ncbi:MAG: capsid protein [Wigfec virus K19_593]|nr:MAG: capsid protein [Wigfec virus K19_593]
MFRRKYAKKRFHKKRAFKKPSSKRSNYKSKSSLKQLIANTVLSLAEVKNQVYTNVLNVAGYTSNNASAQFLPVSPYTGLLDIAQGYGDGERIGNKIRIKKLTMEYILWPLQYNGTTNATPSPQEFKIWFFKDKINTTAVASPTSIQNFFDDGNTTITPTGSIPDLARPVNKLSYTLCTSRIHKIGTAAYEGTGVNVGSQSYANNDFKLNVRHKVDLTRYCPKVMQYDDLASIPTSPLLQCWFECMDSDGAAGVAADLALRMSYTMKVEYTDF